MLRDTVGHVGHDVGLAAGAKPEYPDEAFFLPGRLSPALTVSATIQFSHGHLHCLEPRPGGTTRSEMK